MNGVAVARFSTDKATPIRKENMTMAKSITIAVVGAGSSYTPELIEGILGQSPERLPIKEIRLTDINAERLAVMTGLAERMIRHKNRAIRVRHGAGLKRMLEGVDFVIAQIRVGGMPARYLDESIPAKYGILGQETTGPGGMFKALRTIPAMIRIARVVERVAPDAFILNYTNPSGIIAEAVLNHTGAKCIGLCSGIPQMMDELKARLTPRFPDVKCSSIGLNHFGLIHRITSRGRDITSQVLRSGVKDPTLLPGHKSPAGAKLAQMLGGIPIFYVHYFYYHKRLLAEVMSHKQTRAQQIMKLEKKLFREAADPRTVTKPQTLANRGGQGYSAITFAFMSAIFNNTGEELVCNILNKGAVEGLDDNVVVEVPCRVDRLGAHPLKAGPLPLAFRGTVQALKAYETLTVEAAIRRKRSLAIQALLNHPLAGDLEVIEPLVDEMLAAHGLRFH